MGTVTDHEGIVLSVTDVGEEDRILTILTRDAGLLRAAAGGARSLGKGRAGALDLFARTRLSLHRSGRSGKLPRIREVELEEPFLGIRQEYGRLCAASYMAEVISRTAPEDDPVPSLFDLLSFCLDKLNAGAPLFWTLLMFELRMLTELGLVPETARCVKCGREVKGPSALLVQEGGLAHLRCAGSAAAAVFSAGDTSAIRFFIRILPDRQGALKVREKDAWRLFAAIRLFSVHHLGFEPRTASLLKGPSG